MTDQRERDTYHTRETADADAELGGRFKRLRPSTVIGAHGAAYPKLPEGSPWSNVDPTGVESPLGYSIDEVPDLGIGDAGDGSGSVVSSVVVQPSPAGGEAASGPAVVSPQLSKGTDQ